MSAVANPAAERLVAFLASDAEPGGDPMRDPHLARTWCVDHAIEVGRRPFGAPDLVRLRALRTGLRGAIDAPGGTAARRLGALSRDARLGVEVGIDGPHLTPGVAGVDGAIGRLVLDAVAGTAQGWWRRIRVCAAPDCGRVFLDPTRPGNRSWCDMTTCGNRAKVRAHRARSRASGA